MDESYLAHPDLLTPHIPAITEIVDNQLGHDYLTERQVRDALNPGGSLFIGVAFPNKNTDSDPPITIFYSSLPKGPSGRMRGLTEFDDEIVEQPAAVCIGGVFTQTRLASYLNIDTTDYPGDLLDSELVGVVRTTAVREDLQRQGIGREIVTETVRLHEQQDVDTHLAVAWRGPEGVAIHDILVENGMKPVEEFKDYWLEESRGREFDCPRCGSPCRCPGIIYIG